MYNRQEAQERSRGRFRCARDRQADQHGDAGVKRGEIAGLSAGRDPAGGKRQQHGRPHEERQRPGRADRPVEVAGQVGQEEGRPRQGPAENDERIDRQVRRHVGNRPVAEAHGRVRRQDAAQGLRPFLEVDRNAPRGEESNADRRPDQVADAEQPPPVAREEDVGADRTQEVDGRLRPLGQDGQGHESVAQRPGQGGRPAAHPAPVPQEQRRRDEQDEHRFRLGLRPHLKHFAEGGEGGRAGERAKPGKKEAGIAVDEQHGEQHGQGRREPNRPDAPVAEEQGAGGDGPVLQRGPAEERVALLAGDDPVVALEHLEGDFSTRRFFAA